VGWLERSAARAGITAKGSLHCWEGLEGGSWPGISQRQKAENRGRDARFDVKNAQGSGFSKGSSLLRQGMICQSRKRTRRELACLGLSTHSDLTMWVAATGDFSDRGMDVLRKHSTARTNTIH
jgi:hypothetical protein